MKLSVQNRRFVLTLHILTSVGWFGAIVGFVALSLTGITSVDERSIQAAYIAMDMTATLVLVPLSLLSLLTGIIQSLGTSWGLFQHYWVIFKLVINLIASVILVLYTQTLRQLAGIALELSYSSNGIAMLHSPTALLHAGGAVFLLLAATILSVYKPRGLTSYGWRKQQERKAALG